MAIVNRIAIIPILLELGCESQGLAGISLRQIILSALKGRHLSVSKGEETIIEVLALGD
jgi:hypothetical protein